MEGDLVSLEDLDTYMQMSKMKAYIDVLEKELASKNRIIAQLQTALLEESQTAGNLAMHDDVANLSPCMRAAVCGDTEIMELIIDGLHPPITDADERTHLEAAFLKACECGHLDIVALLVERAGVNVACSKSSGLIWACMTDAQDDALVRYLIQQGCDVNTVQSLPLRLAIAHKNIRIINALTKAGATPFIPNSVCTV